MLRRTFLILPGIGGGIERSLWHRGIYDWDDFTSAKRLIGISSERKQRLDTHLKEAADFLDSGETSYFSRLLPSREHWRVYDEAKDKTTCLDIETDGLGIGARVTVVGMHRNGRSTILVRGQDLTRENLTNALKGSRLLITFNGSSFDLPMLEREYPFLIPRVPHFDLRHGCARVGLHGGLKSIEKQMGMKRGQELEYVTGEQAVYLWHAWERRGNMNALNLLKRYNEEDTRQNQPDAEEKNTWNG
jgi:uncharacterized protein YprB with RNaseH-like and TPR domain